MRSIVITGVSRGLGGALFDELHRAGERILALGRTFARHQLAAARADPGRIRLRHTDLAVPEALPGPDELDSLLAGTERAVLIHNAAVIEPVGAIGTLPPDQLHRAVAVNLLAPMLLTNALLATGRFTEPAGSTAVPGGAGERRLIVLFVSSSAAHRVSGGRAVYGSTKRGMEMFFDTLAAQHAADHGVMVATIDPGIMDTGMQRTLRRYAQSDAYFPDRERFLDRYRRGELGSPAEVARKIIAEYLPNR